MNKKELIQVIAKQTMLSQIDVKITIDKFIEVIGDTLAKGDEVRLIGFGVFNLLERASRKGRNPATGKKINIPASKYPRFRMSKKLKSVIPQPKPVKTKKLKSSK